MVHLSHVAAHFRLNDGIVNLTHFWQTGMMTIQTPSYQRHRFPPEIICHAIWRYHRFCLSFREVKDLLAERGVTVTSESVRQWYQKFDPEYARACPRYITPIMSMRIIERKCRTNTRAKMNAPCADFLYPLKPNDF